MLSLHVAGMASPGMYGLIMVSSQYEGIDTRELAASDENGRIAEETVLWRMTQESHPFYAGKEKTKKETWRRASSTTWINSAMEIMESYLSSSLSRELDTQFQERSCITDIGRSFFSDHWNKHPAEIYSYWENDQLLQQSRLPRLRRDLSEPNTSEHECSGYYSLCCTLIKYQVTRLHPLSRQIR